MSTAHSSSGMKKSQKAERNRSATDSDLFPSSQHASYDSENDYPPHKARLYHLFGMIEKEFDRLYTENLSSAHDGEVSDSVRVRVGGNESLGELAGFLPEANTDTAKTGRKAMQMGQKLRTALGRGPPGRLVFKVGGGQTHRFRLVHRFDGHKDGVWHVASSSSLVGSASADQTARVWSLDSAECVAVYTGHTGSVNCISFAPTGMDSGGEIMVATASGDESAHIWKCPALQSSSSECKGESRDSEGAEERADGEKEEAESGGRRLTSPLMKLTAHTGVVIGCDWLAGGSQIITASWDRAANIYDVETAEVLNILSGHELELTSCSAHPSQKLVLTASKDCTFRLWDFRESIQSVAVFQGHNESVTSIGFCGDKIISASDDRTFKIWDVRNMRSAQISVRINSGVNRIGVSRSGLISLPLDNAQVAIYDLQGQRLLNRRCHSRMACCAAWTESPAANLVTCGFDRHIVSWKATLNKEGL